MGVPANRANSPASDTTAQAGAERDWPVEKRGVMIAGENPMIVLYRPGSDDFVAIASMWTSTWSEAGAGRALVIWVDPEATSLGTQAPVGIFTDNPDLARFVWANFYNDYASITVNGTRALGEIHRPEGWFKSSAMLAFAETWIAVAEDSDAKG